MAIAWRQQLFEGAVTLFHKNVSHCVNCKPTQPAGAAAEGRLLVQEDDHQPVQLDRGQGTVNTGCTLLAAAPIEAGRSSQLPLAGPCTAV